MPGYVVLLDGQETGKFFKLWIARPKEMCYKIYMTKDQVKKVLDRVLTWPQSRQEDAARILSEMEQQDTSPYRLTDEQVAEVKRRLADQNPKFLTLEEVRERFAQRRA